MLLCMRIGSVSLMKAKKWIQKTEKQIGSMQSHIWDSSCANVWLYFRDESFTSKNVVCRLLSILFIEKESHAISSLFFTGSSIWRTTSFFVVIIHLARQDSDEVNNKKKRCLYIKKRFPNRSTEVSYSPIKNNVLSKHSIYINVYLTQMPKVNR